MINAGCTISHLHAIMTRHTHTRRSLFYTTWLDVFSSLLSIFVFPPQKCCFFLTFFFNPFTMGSFVVGFLLLFPSFLSMKTNWVSPLRSHLGRRRANVDSNCNWPMAPGWTRAVHHFCGFTPTPRSVPQLLATGDVWGMLTQTHTQVEVVGFWRSRTLRNVCLPRFIWPVYLYDARLTTHSKMASMQTKFKFNHFFFRLLLYLSAHADVICNFVEVKWRFK